MVHIAVLYNAEEKVYKGEAIDLIAEQETARTAQAIAASLEELGYPVTLLPIREELAEVDAQLAPFSPASTFIFNLCESFGGENLGAARVAQRIEDLGFEHTGATAETIANCMDKGRAKELLLAAGVTTPPFQVFQRPGEPFALRFPVIVKPLSEDASTGITLDSVVLNLRDLQARVDYVLRNYRQPALVEEYIIGREFNAAFWGNDPPEPLPLAEVDYSAIPDPLRQFLTYESKWVEDSFYYRATPVVCPAVVDEESRERLLETAGRAYRALSLRDYGRVDMRYRDGVPYVLEVNENPNLAPDAGYFRAANRIGYTFTGMVERILDIALRRGGFR